MIFSLSELTKIETLIKIQIQTLENIRDRDTKDDDIWDNEIAAYNHIKEKIHNLQRKTTTTIKISSSVP